MVPPQPTTNCSSCDGEKSWLDLAGAWHCYVCDKPPVDSLARRIVDIAKERGPTEDESLGGDQEAPGITPKIRMPPELAEDVLAVRVPRPAVAFMVDGLGCFAWPKEESYLVDAWVRSLSDPERGY
jgi:hypothetical protein